MARVSGELRRILDGSVTLLRRLLFVGIDPADTTPYPAGEREYVLDEGRLGGGSDRYAVVAGEVMRAVVDISPRHATVIDLRSRSLHPPNGMDRLATHTDLPADGTPDGRVAATPRSVDAVARMLGPDLLRVTVLDGDERPIVRWTAEGRLLFGLPGRAESALGERLPKPAMEACRQTGATA
jgi:hypothetical protein